MAFGVQLTLTGPPAHPAQESNSAQQSYITANAMRHDEAERQQRLDSIELTNGTFLLIATAIQEGNMQHGSLIRSIRKHGPDVWQFRWSETGGNGQRVYRKRVIGTVEQYSDAVEARRFAAGILAMPHPADLPTKPVAMTIAELGQHFQHRELLRDDNWRSYSTRRNYEFNLRKWIIPRWGNYELGEVRTIEVESWLRSLPLARSSCAKIRNLMSVLFNHAWRHELFDRNPIKLVRQSAKRRVAPNVLVPAEIKLLLDHLDLRERTLVLVAASTFQLPTIVQRIRVSIDAPYSASSQVPTLRDESWRSGSHEEAIGVGRCRVSESI